MAVWFRYQTNSSKSIHTIQIIKQQLWVYKLWLCRSVSIQSFTILYNVIKSGRQDTQIPSGKVNVEHKSKQCNNAFSYHLLQNVWCKLAGWRGGRTTQTLFTSLLQAMSTRQLGDVNLNLSKSSLATGEEWFRIAARAQPCPTSREYTLGS